MKKCIKYYVLGLISMAIITGGIVYASGLISGLDVSYDNTETGLTSTNINGAIDELYDMMDTHCPSGYKCKMIGSCDYEENHEWDFSYKGDIEEFIIPCDGLYKLEVWGAQGGGDNASSDTSSAAKGGLGGYSSGYLEMKAQTRVYVVVGQNPSFSRADNNPGGYNGGGTGYYKGNSGLWYWAGGGGATHIATVSGTLANIGYDEFVTNGKGLIVAGGGGGAFLDAGTPVNYSYRGGSGGGLTGGTIMRGDGAASGGSAGTQTTGYSFGKGQSYNSGTGSSGGGGGGLYGGSGGGGGSGYIARIPEIVYDGVVYPSTTLSGVNKGNGKAKITLIAY